MTLSSSPVLGVSITTAGEQSILSTIKQAILEKKQLFITTPNPEIVVAAHKNDVYKRALSHADIALPDGTGIVMALKRDGVTIPRILGRDFFEKLLWFANQHAWRVYLLGATGKSNEQSLSRIRKEYPAISGKGSSDLSVTEEGTASESDEQRIINDIQIFAPQLLFVAFGHPKQELWADRVKGMFPETTIMTIGGTLDYFSGSIPKPPALFSTLGLEWLIRLLREPTRIGRIFTAVVIFPLLVIFRSER